LTIVLTIVMIVIFHALCEYNIPDCVYKFVFYGGLSHLPVDFIFYIRDAYMWW